MRSARPNTRLETPSHHRRSLFVGLSVLAIVSLACDEPRPGETLPRVSRERSALSTEQTRDIIAELEELNRHGHYEEGLSRARDALESNPAEPAFHHHLGLFLKATAAFDEAEQSLLRTLEMQPDHYTSFRVLGDLANQRGAPAEAASYFQRCSTGLPDHAGCRYGLALARIELGELDLAAEPLRFAAERLDRADVWTELGRLERRRRRLPEALAAFSRSLALDDHHLPTLLGYGQALVASGRRDVGEVLLERHRQQAAMEDHLVAVRRASQQIDAPAELDLRLAGLYRARGNLDAAEAILRESVASDGGFPPAVLALANHLLQDNKPDEAASLVASLGSSMAAQPAVQFLLGSIEIARRDEKAALSHFEASRKQTDWPLPVYLDAGKAWLAAGFPSHARRAFGKAAAGLPDTGEGYLGLARSAWLGGDPRTALDAALHAAQVESVAGEAHLVIGLLRTESGNHETALHAFSTCLELRALDLLAADGAAKIRLELEHLDPPPEALALFDRALNEL